MTDTFTGGDSPARGTIDPDKSNTYAEGAGVEAPLKHKNNFERTPHQYAEQWLREILNTSTDWDERSGDYGELAFYLANGFLSAHVSSLPVFEPAAELVYVLEGGEGELHRFAKESAIAWIKGLGGEPESEPRRYNGRVDVWCPKLRICVECGSLSPNRLLDMVMDPEVQRAITIPFSQDKARSFALIEWKMVGNWMEVSRIRQEERFERMQKAVECLNL